MNWQLFMATFSLVFISEIPDKTAFAALLMAGEGGFLFLFSGIALAFLIQTFIAVWIGGYIGLLPVMIVKIGTAILFLVFSYLSWRRSHDGEEPPEPETPTRRSSIKIFLKAFMVIFAAEWGDLTQLTTASLAAKYQDRISVFSGALLALWSVTILALILGKKLQQILRPSLFHAISSASLALVGLYFLFEAFVH